MEIKNLTVGELETNCYLLVSKEELIIIDPGGEASRIIEEIKKTKAVPKYIVNTHDHLDHILSNEEISKKTGARILKDLTNKKEIIIGGIILKIISTPGHTKEGICLLGDNFIFTGDTLFKDSYGRTDLKGGSETEIKKSLQKLSRVIKPGMTIYPGHGPIFKKI